MNCFPNEHIVILILTIICIGSLAGFTNYLNYKSIEKDGKISWLKFILTAIGSASLVPLLLNMLSSNLIKEVQNFDQINYFVFAGFCYIAGFFSERFINSMGEKILRDLESTKEKVNEAISTAKNNEEKIDIMVAAESEVDTADIDPQLTIADLVNKSNFKDDNIIEQSENIVKSLAGKYKFRSSKGISKELGYNLFIVEVTLDALENLGIVKKLSKDNKIIWALTNIGMSYFEKLKSGDLQQIQDHPT